MDKLGMDLELFTDKDYFNKMFRKSKSKRSRTVVKTTLKSFEI